MKRARVLAFALALGACARAPADTPSGGEALPPLPDSGGWGVHVLAAARAPDGALWVGTYGAGIYVLRAGARQWESIRSGDSTSISWDFVNAFAFPTDGSVWYGTVGNGFGRSTDGGRTWRNWGFAQLGPEWQYVAPGGIAARQDTVFIATADGLRITGDGGATWRCIQGQAGVGGGAKGKDDGCSERINTLPTEYLLSLALPGADRRTIQVGHPFGLSTSTDGGRTWRTVGERGPAVMELPRTLRWNGGTSSAPAAPARAPDPGPAAHLWFERPIRPQDGNPYVDQTYRYGSTMGGNFQQHQGVEFNNAAGTPVRAVGDGVVVYAGEAEAGANTVAILHDRRWQDQYVFTVYYHNTGLDVRHGQRVRAGDIIARVGNTGRATNDHLHLEVHVAPTADTSAIVDPAQRFPPYTVNPQLWIAPVPGTGIVAGRVFDRAGNPVAGARVYGLSSPYPEETPYSFAETYRERAHPDPAYGEHFAVGDVPAGRYRVGVEIEGARVWRSVEVRAGEVTFVEFRPEALNAQ